MVSPSLPPKNSSKYRHSPISQQKSFPNEISKSQQKSSKIAIFHSASTFQRSIPVISFSKAQRFPSITPKDQITSLISLPSTLSTKSSNIGSGEKNYFPKHILRNAKEFPRPDSYLGHKDLWQSTPNKITQGKTFGLSYAYYRKNFIPGDKNQNLAIHKEMPGPGKYEIDRELGDLNVKNKRRVRLVIKGKNKDFIDEIVENDQSPKKYYFPDVTNTQNKRFHCISFGKGKKFDFTDSPCKAFPGPGQYEGFSEKIRKIKKKK